jgi:hypothetical protein
MKKIVEDLGEASAVGDDVVRNTAPDEDADFNALAAGFGIDPADNIGESGTEGKY